MLWIAGESGGAKELGRLLLYPLSYEGGVGFEALTILQARVKKGFGMAKTKP